MANKPKAASVATPAPAQVAVEASAPVAADPIVVAAAAIEVAPAPEPPIEAMIVEAMIVEPMIVEPMIVESLKEGIAELTAGTETTTLQVNQNKEKVVKTAEDFVAFGQGNMEAFVKSGQIWATGVQDLSKQVAGTAQAQMQETMSVFKTMSTMKSLKDLFELQSAFAKAALEKSMAESGKLTNASLKLTEQALAPITARVTNAVETFGKTA